ncbi:MAG: threonine/serine exporter family protein [Bacteroidetes bacterium]|nr:threonine/serine exporter family protein [Bacteroidota bacterium]
MADAKFSKGSKVSFDDAWGFINKVGIAAHKYGSTSARLESFLVDLSKSFGYEGVFRSNPSEIVFGLRETLESPQRVEVIATSAPDLNLDKLARLGDLLKEYSTETMSLKEAWARIDAIEHVQPPWGKFATMLGYAFVGLGLAALLGAGWLDLLFATIFSMLVYGIVLLSTKLGSAALTWMPLTSAFVVGLLATSLKAFIPELNLVLIILSAVAVILPGYTISLGAGELVAQRVVSGTANLMNGLICLVKQIAGSWLGIVVAGSIFALETSGLAAPVEQIWSMVLFPLLLGGLCVVFQVSRRDFIWAVLVSATAYLGVLGGSSIMDSNLGNLIGTIVAVVVANVWARKTERPTSIVLIPAIVLLVSGSIGFRGLASMAQGDLILGVQQLFQMFVVAMTILAGIMIGYTIIKPEKGL